MRFFQRFFEIFSDFFRFFLRFLRLQLRIQFIRILNLGFGTIFFFRKWEIFAHYKRELYQMKQQVKRSGLSIYLGVGVSGKSPKIVLEFKNVSGSEKIKVFL